MGKRGPPKTPTATLKLRGSFAAGGRDGEPEVRPEIPACPSWVSASGREHWQDVAEMLLPMGLIGKPFSIVLGLLVDALADYVHRSKQAAECELYTTTGKGMFPHPIHGMRDKAWSRVLKAAQQFGLSPASIAGVTKLGSAKERKLDKFKLA
jgi:P27 family predicted phage terminase small subunit